MLHLRETAIFVTMDSVKKKLLGLISIVLIFIGFFLFFQVIGNILPKGQGALQVTSSVPAKVILNGKNIGTTPLCKCEGTDKINEGKYTLQLVPVGGSLEAYTTRIKIGRGVLTAFDRTFLPGSFASAYTLNLEKSSSPKAELFISSLPSGALVTIDGQESGTTPISIPSISASEHEIELQKGEYSKKTIRVKTINSYKLVVEAVLGTQPEAGEILPGSETTATPTPSVSSQSVTISSTPTGFLRVRETASTLSSEIGRVLPGDILPLLDEETDWYHIQLPNGTTGWISTSFAVKSANN